MGFRFSCIKILRNSKRSKEKWHKTWPKKRRVIIVDHPETTQEIIISGTGCIVDDFGLETGQIWVPLPPPSQVLNFENFNTHRSLQKLDKTSSST